jgi:hypothetical protein
MTHIFEEDLENTTGLFVNETGDTLHTTTASETANGGFCDTLDVVAKDFTMTLSTTLAKTLQASYYKLLRSKERTFFKSYLSTFTTARHVL